MVARTRENSSVEVIIDNNDTLWLNKKNIE